MREGRPVVLIAEDEHDIATIETEVLEAEGYTVAVARNGRQALALLDLVQPDLVLLDLMMPELDGFGFLTEYRRRPEPRPPVLVVSAFDGYLDAAAAAGATETIPKPFGVDELVRRVHALVRGAGGSSGAGRPVPLDEHQRLRAILELQLEVPSPGAALDAFAQRVARIFDAPICLVSIVTASRQYWHAHCGLPDDLAAARGTPRADSFCTHAVVAKAALVVQDAAVNPFFATNPFVRDRGIRFYAGVPLVTRFGAALGTLCLLDRRPRTFGAFDLELLSVLARRVVAELEWRERRQRPGAPPSGFMHLAWLDEELDVLGREALVQALQIQCLRAAERRVPLALLVVATARDDVGRACGELKLAFPRALLGRLGLARLGVLAEGAAAGEARPRALAAVGAGAAVQGIDVPRLVGGVEEFLRQAEEALGDAGLVGER
ncbi:MAG TPA: response regulator [Anaeromyxobacteraceae bacterium]|nr:response regulator [Anaeromyxobacteraceae bacterium]